MPLRFAVSPEILTWAAERSGTDREELLDRFPKLPEWETGDGSPTVNQLTAYARLTRTPLGFLFLEQPPDETVPVPDFRTVGGVEVRRPSPDLLDTIHQCQQRQAWYRSWAINNGVPLVPQVGSATTDASIDQVSADVTETLGYQVAERGSTWSEALRILRENAEAAGFLVMINGVVGNNTRRKLDPSEFRGFALVDEIAPTVFVNGADSKAAQIFTLLHELAHLWLGQSSLDGLTLDRQTVGEVEHWCNRVAAEVAAPLEIVVDGFNPNLDLTAELDRLARLFKVSTLVVLRRIYEAGLFDWNEFRIEYAVERDRVLALIQEQGGTGGGDFYNTQPLRVSAAFARALIADTLEGGTTYSEAFRMLGVRKSSTFDELGARLGVA